MGKYLNIQECVSNPQPNTSSLASLIAGLDTKAIDSMKAKMLVQIPGTKMLHLPTFDAKRGKVENNMDHLVRYLDLYTLNNVLIWYRHALYPVCSLWVPSS